MFARATSSASTDASVSHTCAASAPSSNAIDRPITPLPVPRSTTRKALLLSFFSAISTAISSATCTTCSVSGRGISTRSSIMTSRCLNAHRFMTYCSGTPLSRSRTIECKLLAHATVTNWSCSAENSAASIPLACSHNHRAS